jgi:hypothetical protein
MTTKQIMLLLMHLCAIDCAMCFGVDAKANNTLEVAIGTPNGRSHKWKAIYGLASFASPKNLKP